MSPARDRAPDPAARSPEIDAYLATVGPAEASALEKLRRTIRAAAPEAVETISYGVPAFKYRGRPLVSFVAAKRHLSFFVQSPAVMEAHSDLVAGYDTSKGTVRFTPDEPLPDKLVATLVRARIAETDAAANQE
jgi:uncharacterized protein YdhG (YjbR/CyaY superfamily)